jgi:hypothetical protein
MVHCDHRAGLPLEVHNLFIRLSRLTDYLASVRFCLAEGRENATTGRVVRSSLEVILLYQIVLEGKCTELRDKTGPSATLRFNR